MKRRLTVVAPLPDPFGYQETDNWQTAFDRSFYMVEKWTKDDLHVEALIHASNDLEKARAIFERETMRRPRARYTLRQGIRVLRKWPQV